jgi:hypothetical protein
VLERVTFPKIRTFDSSRAPDSIADSNVVLAPIDREAIAGRLQAVAKEAIANDPVALKRRVAELERQLKAGGTRTDAEMAAARAEGERIGFDKGATHGYGCGWDEHAKAMHAALGSIARDPPSLGDRPKPPQRIPRPVSRPAPLPRVTNGSGGPIAKGEAAVLAACIQFPDGLRREQITVLTGYKRSTRDAYIQRLREKGYVSGDGDLIRATDEGCAALPDAEPLPTGEALQDYWFHKLPEGERAILRVLVERYPAAVPRDELTEETSYKRSTRDAYLQRLSAKQLVSEPSRGEVMASETLF